MPTSRSATKSTNTDTNATKPKKTQIRPKSPGRRKSPIGIKNVTTSTMTKATVVTRQRKEEAENRKLTPPLSSSRPRSPFLSGRSPIRKSPVRTSKLKQNIENFYSESRPWNLRKTMDVDTDSDSAENRTEIKEKPKATVRASTRKIEDQYDERDNTRDSVTKDMYRRSRSHDIDRITYLRHYNTCTRKLGEFSDDDDHQHHKYDQQTKLRKSQSIDRFVDNSIEFGGSLGVLLLIISAILSLLYLYIMCNNVQCTYTQLPDLEPYYQLSTYFNAISFLGMIIYLSLIAILSVLPFGGRRVYGLPNRQGKLFYVLNGIFITIVILSIAIGCEYYGIGLFHFIVEHTFHLLISAMIIGFLLSNYVYIRSFYVPITSLNMHVINKNPIYAYFMGRELNPRVFNLLDIKMFVLRSAIIGTVLMDFAYFCENLDLKIDDFEIESFSFQPTIFFLILFHTIYLLDPLIYEQAWLTTFETQYEGCGFMTAFGHLIYPFMMISMTKYLIDFNIELVYWKLILISLQFVIGLVLFRGSNNQKDAFRKNPYDPALAHLETIPTGHGKKLICSGYWGIVRHPNYLGDILMNLCFAWFAPFVLPSIPYYCIVVLLIHRSIRDNYRCKQKYGSAWTRYCNRVKYILIPKIY